ncbi:hypothetical protein PFISCL1PPCAC_27360, partial [Pristionchus fissidentatus]
EWESSSHLAAWPESKRLKSALTERRKSIKYTLPGIKYEIVGTKPLSEELKMIMRDSFESIDEEKNWNGLKQIIDAREHLSAVEATSKILTLLGQGMDKSGRSSSLTPFGLEVWSIRFQLLFGLKKYKELLDEMTSFEELDAPDLFFQYHDDAKQGSMLPFALRMIHTEALVHSPLPTQAIGRVDRLISDIETILDDLSSNSAPPSHIEDWKKRLKAVVLMRIRILFVLEETELVLNAIEDLRSTVENREKDDLSFLLTRLCLMGSDEKRALDVAKETEEAEEEKKQQQDAFHAMYKGDLKKMLEIEEGCKKNSESASTINNLAIACLYNGNPLDAVSLLIEEARRCITSNESLHPIIAQNIRTISELTHATTTKTTILKELQAVLPQQ